MKSKEAQEISAQQKQLWRVVASKSISSMYICLCVYERWNCKEEKNVGAGRILLSISFVLYKWRASRAHIHSHILFIAILYIFIYMCMYVCVLCAFICLLSLKFSLFSLLCQATFAYTWAKRIVLLFFFKFFVNSSPSCLVFNFVSLSAAIYCYNIFFFCLWSSLAFTPW